MSDSTNPSESKLKRIKEGNKIYVRQTQAIQGFKNYFDALDYIAFGGKEVEVFETNEQPAALWGTGVYGVAEDGSLFCINANWDTSD
jgi:hypothetical protein